MGQRLIDAEALRQEIDGCDFDSQTDKLTICQQIREAPTVDAVPVVRCRECKHSYESISGPCCSFGPCVDTIMSPDGFCSYGEREED